MNTCKLCVSQRSNSNGSLHGHQYLKVSKFAVLQKKDLEAVCYPTFILGGGGKAVELKLFIETNFYSTHRHSVFVDFIKMGFVSLQ